MIWLGIWPGPQQPFSYEKSSGLINALIHSGPYVYMASKSPPCTQPSIPYYHAGTGVWRLHPNISCNAEVAFEGLFSENCPTSGLIRLHTHGAIRYCWSITVGGCITMGSDSPWQSIGNGTSEGNSNTWKWIHLSSAIAARWNKSISERASRSWEWDPLPARRGNRLPSFLFPSHHQMHSNSSCRWCVSRARSQSSAPGSLQLRHPH